MSKTLVMVLGVVFVLIGIWGFFTSDNMLLGMFEVDTVHNMVHLLSGVLALAMAAMGESSAKLYGKIFGVVYALVTVLGFVMPDQKLLGLMQVNLNDNYLHLVLAVVLLWIGFSRSSQPMSSNSGMGSGM